MSDNAQHHAPFTPPSGPPRQGPGSDTAVHRLLPLAGPLPERPRVLGLGRGPGRGALLLASAAGAEVTAADPHEPFLAELRETAAARGLEGSIRTVRADLGALPFPDGSFDVVRAESPGVLGFDRALAEWRRLLAPGGTLVLTERVRAAPGPGPAARALRSGPHPLRTVAENAAAAIGAGWHVLGCLTGPESDREAHHGPLTARADTADITDPGMAEAVAGARDEFAPHREHGTSYGYADFVLRPVDPRWPVRPERDGEAGEVREITAAAFGSTDEADLVDALRRDPDAWLPGLSHVAEAPDGQVVAHALITRCRVGDAPAAALAPVSVTPGHQRTGAGQAVVRAVLDAARLRGERLVLVLGHPEYYPRFGFVRASEYGIRPGFEVPDEAMMALVLDDSMPVPSGTITYPAAFGV
ncbi:GNAT family N-acetyltransferase [Streptomyces sp. NPDC088557]|uniref:GNAT family N-acetyltransferase n=1 Tax=Streptomyces sp. NPDC088557 TaxID=3365867 RepID=UPI0038048894